MLQAVELTIRLHPDDAAFQRGNFRVRGDSLEIFPSHYEDMAWRVSFFGDEIEEIAEFDPLTGSKGASLDTVRVYANSHYVTPGPTMKQATQAIRFELEERLNRVEDELATYVAETSWATAMTVDAQTQMVKQYCVTCHSDRGKAGGLTLASFDAAQTEYLQGNYDAAAMWHAAQVARASNRRAKLLSPPSRACSVSSRFSDSYAR